MIPRALAAWGNMRGSMAAELAERPPEGRLLAYVMISLTVMWASSIPLTLQTAINQGEMGADVAIGMSFGLYLLVMPLFYYGLAALLRLLARPFGGKAGFYEHRLALFWATLVVTPALILLNALALAVDLPLTIGALSALVTVLVAGHMLSQANGYASVWRGIAQAAAVGAVLISLMGAALVAASLSATP
ncbi:MAG: hypothetical protein ACJA1L_003756 [Paracoccaceae bacterium]|jgi:hypothetical protein